MWNFISKYDAEILSAPSKRVLQTCMKGKRMWCATRLGSPVIHFRSANKKREFANKNSILIDDLKSNIASWKASGGIGIHHKNTNSTISQLKELGM